MKTAFIPARKGSKGLPGKNKKLFFGKPLIQYTIDQAKEAGIFDRIVVSSDDDEILEIAQGCEVDACKRLPELSTDEASIDEVLYDFFSREENKCDIICLLNPTSPLRTVDDILETYKFIQMKKYDTVTTVHWHDFIGWVEDATNKGPVPTYNIGKRPNRQTRDNFFMENGSIYWFKYHVIMVTGTFTGDPAKAKLYEIPVERSFEIDTEFDWFLCERVHEYLSMA